MEEEHNTFVTCRTCGKYIRKEDLVYDYYCSPQCSHMFTQCMVCGKYFLSNEGFGKKICSRTCAVQYKIAKTYQNETISIKYKEEESS